MAVQKNRKSHSRTKMRRAHQRARRVTLSSDQQSGEIHKRHHVAPDGYYRGREVIARSVEEAEEE